MTCCGHKILGFSLVLFAMSLVPGVLGQDFLPAAPSDRTLIYTLDEANHLTPLPFEVATTPLKVDAIAKNTKASYVELKGEHAAATLSASPRIFLFTT